MTEEDLKTFLAENAPEFKKAVADRMIRQLADSYSWSMPAAVDEEVKNFIKDQVVPEVRKYLVDNKGPIIEAVMKSIATIGDEISKTMLKQALENVQGYRGGEVIKSMFGFR